LHRLAVSVQYYDYHISLRPVNRMMGICQVANKEM